MPKSNTPYDPQPERKDALGELANKGYQKVPGDHASRLSSLQDRLGLPQETSPASEAIVRRMPPRRWLAIAAGLAALLVAGIALFNYDTTNEQSAKVVTVEDSAPINTTVELLTAENAAVEQELDQKEEVLETNVVDQEIKTTADADFIPVKTGDLKPTSSAYEGQKNTSSIPQVAKEKPQKDVEYSSSESSKKLETTAGIVTAAPAAPALKAIPEADQNTVEANDINEEIASTSTAESTEVQASNFRMERSATVTTREISGEVIEPSGSPIIGAILTIEETGQQVISDQKGEFKILLTEDAIVGNVSAEGYPELIFDVTAGDEYRLYLPRVSSSIPSAQLKGKAVGLRLIAPKAERYSSFDEFVAQQPSAFSGEEVTVQFDVNRFGRPRNIVSGPGPQRREAIKKLKEWLKNGPDWPEQYHRKAWRYNVKMP